MEFSQEEENLIETMLADSIVRSEWRLYGDETSRVLSVLLKCAAVEFLGYADRLPGNFCDLEKEAVDRLVSTKGPYK